MIPGAARRLQGVTALAVEVNRVRSTHPGRIPPPASMVGAQRMAARLGGAAAAAAEITSSYTSVRPSATTTAAGVTVLRAGGRLATRPMPDGITRSWFEPDGRRRLDLGILDVLCASVLVGRADKRAFLRDLIAALGEDIERNADASAVEGNVVAIASSLDAVEAPLRVIVLPSGRERPSAPAPLELRLDTPGELADPVEQAHRLLSGAGIVHGRLGAASHRSASGGWTATHWETARRVSDPCREFLVGLVSPAPSTGDLDRLVDQGAALGVPADALADDLGFLLELLAPVTRRWENVPPSAAAVVTATGATGPSSSGVTLVPDPLGVMYGIADLLALREARPRP